MTSRPVPLSLPSTDEQELAAVAEVLESGWLAGQGPRGAALEQAFCSLTARRHAIAVNNCTAGLHLALAALGIGPGDEVLVADYTFPATAHAVLYCGATPRFADVRGDTGTLDIAAAVSRLTAATRAIVAVDALGVPADWDQLSEFAGQHGLALVADAACSVGGTFRGQPCGAFGDVAAFSLHARKGITSGEGGVVVTDDPEVAHRIRRASCFGMQSAFRRHSDQALSLPSFTDLGYNYKLSDVLAAIGLVQLEKLEEFLRARRTLARRYNELLEDVPLVSPPPMMSDRSPTWQTYAVTVDDVIDRDGLIQDLRSRGIGCTIGTYALHREPVYDSKDDCPVSAHLFDTHLALPMFVGLDEQAQDRVVRELRDAVRSRMP